ncbi:hypothetical protein BXY66_2961 [Shimia isoporae]|uniref:Uncharacterized protein n=1 Tax=Shimia isoporae TaxID=647720 RepID=A0A4R1N1T9_9RHOB|nr:hypothetical protein [Shimia isoporae]TCL00320.1 hypothetical protein BXY66_2961 [Shimia isoporae]
MHVIGPHKFKITEPGTNDLHILYAWSGGSLKNPRVIGQPQPKKIVAKDNQVHITWENEVPQGTSVSVQVDSLFKQTKPISYQHTKDGKAIGEPIPYHQKEGKDWRRGMRERWPVEVGPRAPASMLSTGRLGIINREHVIKDYSGEVLAKNLHYGGFEKEDADKIANIVSPYIVAVGRNPVSTLAMRAIVGETVMNRDNPDPTAIRAAIMADHANFGSARPFPAVVGNEHKIIQMSGRFLAQVETASAMVAAGERPPDEMINLYDEGVSIQAHAAEMAISYKQFCLHPMTHMPIKPTPMPSFEVLLDMENRYGFVPMAMLKAFFAPTPTTDWQAVIEEILFKTLGALDLIDFYVPILEILRGGEFKDVWEDLLRAAAEHDFWELVKTLLEDFLLSDKFRELLIKKLGKEVAEEILEKMLQKWIPILGWAQLIGNIIAVLIVQMLYYYSLIFGPFILPK